MDSRQDLTDTRDHLRAEGREIPRIRVLSLRDTHRVHATALETGVQDATQSLGVVAIGVTTTIYPIWGLPTYLGSANKRVVHVRPLPPIDPISVRGKS